MKRALFKMGKRIAITSTTTASKFELEVDTVKWAKDRDNWDFRFKDYDTEKHAVSEIGTRIEVTQLYDGISAQAAQPAFLKNLREELARRHQNSGIDIALNGKPVTFSTAMLLSSKSLQPAHEIDKIGKVSVEIFAGLAEDRSPVRDAGWSVFCNGRLILDADKTETTGWGEKDEVGLPMFHPQFNRFRGFVFFDSDDPRALPWNTTKTDVDMDSALYRGVRQKMISVARPIIDFLNELKDAKAKAKDQEIPVEIELNRATRSRLNDLPKRKTAFRAPKLTVAAIHEDSDDLEIVYYVSADKFDIVRQKLRVRTARAVGERTFEYFYSMECE